MVQADRAPAPGHRDPPAPTGAAEERRRPVPDSNALLGGMIVLPDRGRDGARGAQSVAATAQRADRPQPIGVAGVDVDAAPLSTILNGLLLLLLAAAVASMVIRFRRSNGIERQQLKWFTYAGVVVLLAPLSNSLLPEPLQTLPTCW